MLVSLTEGVIPEICSGNCPDNLQPVLQVTDLRPEQNSDVEKYRLVLSDGSFYQQGVMATRNNELVHSGRLQQGSIVTLSRFACHVFKSRKIIFVIDLDVILDKCELIGEPVPASGVCVLANAFNAMNLGTGAYNPIINSNNADTSRGFDFGMPSNQVGQQHGSQYNNFASAGAHTSCTNCGGSGHSSLLCPNIISLPLGSGSGASAECFKCNQPGHWARDCPGFSAAPSSYGVAQNQQFGGGY